MEDIRPIAPVRHALVDKRVRVPASKSIANRELVLSAIAHGRSRLELGPLDPGDDVHAMTSALAAMGYAARWDGSTVAVEGGGDMPPATDATVNAREAGTVARFGTALAALGPRQVRIDAGPRLRARPMATLVDALRALGATVDNASLPLTIRGPLVGGEVDVPGHESSQFASALLLVAARTRDGIRLRLVGPIVSAPFVALTVSALAARGVRVERPAQREFIVAPQRVKARSFEIPGDVTAATYPAAAAAILGGAVTIVNARARVEPGGQGDARFFELIEDMGCEVHRSGDSVTVRRVGGLQGITANVMDCSDVFPTLAVIATQAATPSELTGIAHTRAQESDRVAVVAAGIQALGGRATAYRDAIRVEPAPLHDGVVDAAGDHRIAMAFSVLGLQIPGVAIKGASAVNKTFPDFYEVLRQLGR
ncbi:MAG TPA: 3-phosphoshikimate 1-carboxyvinyltransferase [Candidatus Limnocylindria bacterium]|nr:3-phosphoshikimate 1-carboxyvinyltransferase [Candidatus Limnocylindria bacterium]